MNLNALVDELEIRRIVDEIDNSCDLKDWDRCRSFFADDVDVDFVSLAGGEPATIKADDLIGAWRTNLFEDKITFHQRGNHVIDLVGDRATVFSKGYAFNMISEGPVTGMWEVWANYTHTLVRVSSGWKVDGMKLDAIQTRGDDRVRAYVPG
jgi:hypothetical protein